MEKMSNVRQLIRDLLYLSYTMGSLEKNANRPSVPPSIGLHLSTVENIITTWTPSECLLCLLDNLPQTDRFERDEKYQSHQSIRMLVIIWFRMSRGMTYIRGWIDLFGSFFSFMREHEWQPSAKPISATTTDILFEHCKELSALCRGGLLGLVSSFCLLLEKSQQTKYKLE